MEYKLTSLVPWLQIGLLIICILLPIFLLVWLYERNNKNRTETFISELNNIGLTGGWDKRSRRGHFSGIYRRRLLELNFSEIYSEISGLEISSAVAAGTTFFLTHKLKNPDQFSLSARPAGMRELFRGDKLIFEGVPDVFVEKAQDLIMTTMKDGDLLRSSPTISLKDGDLVSTWLRQTQFFTPVIRNFDLLCDLADLVENWERDSIPAIILPDQAAEDQSNIE